MYYNIPLAQLLYAGDDVSGEVWDSRNWNTQENIRYLAYLFFLAIVSTYRSKRYGSRAIETLKAEYPNKKQVVDFEPEVFKEMMKTIQVNGFNPKYFYR